MIFRTIERKVVLSIDENRNLNSRSFSQIKYYFDKTLEILCLNRGTMYLKNIKNFEHEITINFVTKKSIMK